MKRSIVGAACLLAALSIPAGFANAHHAAHHVRPDGTCVEVGSNRDAPIVGENHPNQSPGLNNQPRQLDLIPGVGDQQIVAAAVIQGKRLHLPEVDQFARLYHRGRLVVRVKRVALVVVGGDGQGGFS